MKYKLDDSQKNAVIANEKNILVVAAPGSGKTLVIINRTAYLIKNRGISPKNIIVITFTKAAAKNMKERYIKIYGEKYTPFFGTFHGLFYKILKRYKGSIKIIEEYEKYRLIRGILLKYMDEISDDKIKEVVNDISLMKSRQEAINDFKSHVDLEVFKECVEGYNRYKEENELMDFDDLQIECIKLFKENKKLLQGYGKLFKHILVDEFQDVDSLQIELLKMFNDTSNIYAVGDEDQCIYSFRGSKPECMVEFQNIFNGGQRSI
ncbi:UvrD-helicase domain-containing protein [Clostridium sp. DMHC 10]|uniref:ATP-dependent helicase n=1 Tax=Clostridium sp. DMHC 10 TaxID=747377 RepID=UPI000AC3B6A9|nr:UvrD-helicase domain-containing protein [Clostridium sp. DMHC 10]